MRRRLLILLAVIGLLGIGALLVLRSYSVDLVHAVVVNAIEQKAPEGYPAWRIEAAFERRRADARQSGTEAAYVAQLNEISIRIEKVQRLERAEVDELLNKVATPE